MPIKTLIANDLQRFSQDPNLVASEEALRFIIHHYHQSGMLSNPKIVPYVDLPSQLNTLHKNKEPSHVQFFIEFNSRSLSSRAVHFKRDILTSETTSIHYAAMDVFCDEQGSITAFIADHYFGKDYRFHGDHDFLKQFKFPIYFIIAGGSYHQTDSSHCPIFTLQHLLLTAHDTALHTVLKDRVRDLKNSWNYTVIQYLQHNIEPNTIYVEINKKAVKYTLIHWHNNSIVTDSVKLRSLKLTYDQAKNIDDSLTPSLLNHLTNEGYLPRTATLPWFDLEPRYNVFTQSFKELTENYPEFLRQRDKIESKTSSIAVLQDAKFDEMVGPHIVCEVNKNNQNKALNKGIEFLTKDISAVALANICSYSEEELINFCYGERYPMVESYLKSVLNEQKELQKKEPTNLDIALNAAKIFSFIFSNQFVLNCLTLGAASPASSFALFISRPSVIKLALLNFIDIEELFYNITFVETDTRTFNKKFLNNVINNKEICADISASRWENPTYTIESIHTLELLLHPQTAPLFLMDKIKRLYLSGKIKHHHLININSHGMAEINKTDLSSTDDDAALLALFNPHISPVSVTDFQESSGHSLGFFNQNIKPIEHDLEQSHPPEIKNKEKR